MQDLHCCLGAMVAEGTYLSLEVKVASSGTRPVRVAQTEQRRQLVTNLSQQPGVKHSCLFPGPCVFSSVNVASVAILTSFGKNS